LANPAVLNSPETQPHVQPHQPHPQPHPTGNFLPTEILQVIFEWYAALFCTFGRAAPETSAHLIASVCHHWRELALILPGLWNHPPIIRISSEAVRSKGFLTHWVQVLNRSGSLPLKLHLSFYLAKIPRRSYDALKPFVECSARWEHITISGLTVSQTQNQFLSLHGNIPVLRSVTLNFVPTTFVPTTFTMNQDNSFSIFQVAPKLSTIFLHSSSLPQYQSRLSFPWDQLTHHTETGYHIRSFPTILDFAPCMESLDYDGTLEFYPISSLVTHTHLRRLSVDTGWRIWEHLSQLTLPSLESFYIGVPKNEPGTLLTSGIVDLVVRSRCSLKHLGIRNNPEVLRRNLIEVFLRTPDLETLEIGTCHTAFFYDMVRNDLVFDKNCPTVLPRLRSLTLMYHENYVTDDYDLVSRIAKSRSQVSLDDSSPGQLYVVLEHVRIVSSHIYTRYRAMRYFVKWEDHFDVAYLPYLDVSNAIGTWSQILIASSRQFPVLLLRPWIQTIPPKGFARG
jgi:hypothetical protein